MMNRKPKYPRLQILSIASVFMVLLFATTTSLAQQYHTSQTAGAEPSLQNTLDWIKGFVARSTGATHTTPTPSHIIMTATFSSLDHCNVEIADILQDDVDKNRQEYRIYNFSLADIDPTQIRTLTMANADSFDIILSTRNDTKLIKKSDYYQNRGDVTRLWDMQNSKEFGAEIGLFGDKTTAQRVVTALQHAANLCAMNELF